MSCNPSIWEVESRRSGFKARLGYMIPCLIKRKEQKRKLSNSPSHLLLLSTEVLLFLGLSLVFKALISFLEAQDQLPETTWWFTTVPYSQFHGPQQLLLTPEGIRHVHDAHNMHASKTHTLKKKKTFKKFKY